VIEEVPGHAGVPIQRLVVVGVGVYGVLRLFLHHVESVDGVDGFLAGDEVVVDGVGEEGVEIDMAGRVGEGGAANEEGDGDAHQQKETRNDDAQEHPATGTTPGSEISQHFLTLKNSQRKCNERCFKWAQFGGPSIGGYQHRFLIYKKKKFLILLNLI